MEDSKTIIKNEQEFTNKILVDLAFKQENIKEFVDPKIMALRKYTKLLPVIQGYSRLLSDCEADVNKAGFFAFTKTDDIRRKIEIYKTTNIYALKQLQYCNDCLCSDCINECGFDSCFNCREESWVNVCDKQTLNGVRFDNRQESVEFDGETFDYKVESIMQVLESEGSSESRRYIFMQNVYDEEDKQVLAYFPRPDGADFNTIEGEEFETVIADHQRYF